MDREAEMVYFLELLGSTETAEHNLSNTHGARSKGRRCSLSAAYSPPSSQQTASWGAASVATTASPVSSIFTRE